jgi:gliding motility-associated-like protein
MKVFNILFFFLLPFSIYCQLNVYQDILNGGITGNGYNSGFSNDIGIINVNIEAGSSIKKAFLFTSIYQNPSPATIYINGNAIDLNCNDALVSDFFSAYGATIYNMKSIITDITNIIDPNDNSYTLIPPQNQSNDIFTNGGFLSFYLLIIYENTSLPESNISVFFNDKNSYYSINYLFSELNPIDTNYNVAFTINATDICDTFIDGSFVKINNQLLGLIGGQEDNTNWSCTGSKGSFYYQNNTTFGIGNDVANTTMAGSDVLANIESYLSSTASFDATFNYQQGFSGGHRSNPIHQLFLAYTTTCDTFSVSVPNDTTVCQGETLQLFATGGNSTGALPAYEWIPATGLSCNTCPNPIFTADSSMLYTVRIRNNDSCSVVRPVKIIVRPKPQIGSISMVPSECGAANGSLTVNSMNGTQLPISYTIDGNLPQSNSVFSNLSASNYTIALIDGFGCQSEDSLVEVGTINSTISNFTVSPSTGAAPLTVAIANSSQNASNFNWFVNDLPQGTSLNAYTFNTSGNYTIELVAWQFDPTCADTFSLTISVYDSVIIQIPNVFTPNNDGINDYFSLNSNFELQADVSIVNRWGNVVFSFTGNINAGTTNLWDGKDIFTQFPVFDGTYFYKITFIAPEGSSLPFETGTFPISKEGFVEVRSSH